MYPEPLVAPMRAELTSIGVKELKTPEDVANALENTAGTTLLVINSVCGCAAGSARPAVKLALQHSKQPDQIVTVFAGVDKDAVSKARSYLLPFPPSSPSMALLKDGKVVHMIERHQIEGRPAQMIAQNLMAAYEEYCN
jgi:putative YphP/YqiW family bacilliredoxin